MDEHVTDARRFAKIRPIVASTDEIGVILTLKQSSLLKNFMMMKISDLENSDQDIFDLFTRMSRGECYVLAFDVLDTKNLVHALDKVKNMQDVDW